MSQYTTSAQSALGREVAEKRRLMYERHGGVMSPTDVAREAGYFARAVNGDRWAEEHGIPAIRMGRTWWRRRSSRAVEWYKNAPPDE